MKSQIDAVLESKEKCRRHRDNWKARALVLEMDNKNLKTACSMQRDEIDKYKSLCDGLHSDRIDMIKEVNRLKAIIEGLECENKTWHNPKGAMCGVCSNCKKKQEGRRYETTGKNIYDC